jgi:hypothetical protein
VSHDRVFPAGWISLRTTGQTSAALGIQRFNRNGHVELSLVGTDDNYAVIRRREQLTLDMGGVLHWGQSNGPVKRSALEAGYGAAGINRWIPLSSASVASHLPTTSCGAADCRPPRPSCWTTRLSAST